MRVDSELTVLTAVQSQDLAINAHMYYIWSSPSPGWDRWNISGFALKIIGMQWTHFLDEFGHGQSDLQFLRWNVDLQAAVTPINWDDYPGSSIDIEKVHLQPARFQSEHWSSATELSKRNRRLSAHQLNLVRQASRFALPEQTYRLKHAILTKRVSRQMWGCKTYFLYFGLYAKHLTSCSPRTICHSHNSVVANPCAGFTYQLIVRSNEPWVMIDFPSDIRTYFLEKADGGMWDLSFQGFCPNSPATVDKWWSGNVKASRKHVPSDGCHISY